MLATMSAPRSLSGEACNGALRLEKYFRGPLCEPEWTRLWVRFKPESSFCQPAGTAGTVAMEQPLFAKPDRPSEKLVRCCTAHCWSQRGPTSTAGGPHRWTPTVG